MPTPTDIILAVRELSFDRFLIPGIAFKAIPTYVLDISDDRLTIHKAGDASDIKYTADLLVLDTFDKLTADLMDKQIIFAYTPYYFGQEKTNTFIKVTDKPLEADYTAYKKYFMSDDRILEWMRYYYMTVLQIDMTTTADLNELVPKLEYPNEKHIAIKVAYWCVDRRRLYEFANISIGQNFTDGSVYSTSMNESTTESVTVQIGDVFTLEENPHNGELTERFNAVGSDNVLGDKYSFWYRLLLYLRSKLEEFFADYSLRLSEAFTSDTYVDRNDLNFRAYYDSYPFRISPLSRSILTSSP